MAVADFAKERRIYSPAHAFWSEREVIFFYFLEIGASIDFKGEVCAPAHRNNRIHKKAGSGIKIDSPHILDIG